MSVMRNERVSNMLPVTMIVLTYNQEKYVRSSLESALAQDYGGPLEIFVSDDASTDGTPSILRDVLGEYQGPHEVRLNLNNSNMGLIDHLNYVFAAVKNDFIVCMAGDDRSHLNRVSLLAQLHIETGASLVFSNVEFMDKDGCPLREFPIETLFSRQWTLEDVATSSSLFIGASAAYHKNIIDRFGPIQEEGAYEDLVLGFRAALLKSIAFHNQPLVCYRVGQGMSHADAQGNRSRAQAHATRLSILRQRYADAIGYGLPSNDPVIVALRAMISDDQNTIASLVNGFEAQDRCEGSWK